VKGFTNKAVSAKNPIHCVYAPVHLMAVSWAQNGLPRANLGSWPIYELGGWTGYTL